MTAPHDPNATIRFAESVLQLLDQGGFVATYKYAVLLGLIDLCLEGTTRTGAPPDVLTTRQLAEKVIDLYWPQTADYQLPDGLAPLKQNTSGQAKIVSDILSFRASSGEAARTLHRARLASPTRWLSLVDKVEWTLILMPLPRLQVVGRLHRELVYRIAWDLSIERNKASVTAYQRALRHGPVPPGSTDFDNRIHLLPGVAEHLVLLNGLLRPLIHREWARLVAHINKLHESRLEAFLFGTDRRSTAVLQPGLRDLQDNRCFYCDKRLPDSAEVDHFIPWARYPDDAIENLVLADRRCNAHKRDFLAAPEHVTRWSARFGPSSTLAPELQALAASTNWETAPTRTLGVARGLYLRLRDDAFLWHHGPDLIPADPDAIRRVLQAA